MSKRSEKDGVHYTDQIVCPLCENLAAWDPWWPATSCCGWIDSSVASALGDEWPSECEINCPECGDQARYHPETGRTECCGEIDANDLDIPLGIYNRDLDPRVQEADR